MLLPFWISILVLVVRLDRRCSGIAGPAQRGVLRRGGLVDEPIALVRNETGVLIGMIHVMVPYAVLTLYANMRRHRCRARSRRRAASAPRRFQAFRMVFLPLTTPPA